MKIRLYKGPFAGKTYDTDGREHIIITGPKKMTRKQEYEWFKSQGSMFGMKPRVEARYQRCYRPIVADGVLTNVPVVHPDGSVFYEYVDGSKREIG